MDDLDRGLINALQDGIPICERPFAEAAMRFGLTEQEVADRIAALREAGFLSRFGPMYDAVRLGGG